MTFGKIGEMAFRVVIIGGTGQVGSAVVRALDAEPSCAEVVMVNRRATALVASPRVRQVVLDTVAARFPADVTTLASSTVAKGGRTISGAPLPLSSSTAQRPTESFTSKMAMRQMSHAVQPKLPR